MQDADVRSLFDDMTVGYVEFYVDDLGSARDEFVMKYGLGIQAAVEKADGSRSVALGSNDIEFVMTAASDSDHPAAGYVEQHGAGVANIALAVRDAGAAFTEAVRRGARPVAEPAEHNGITVSAIGGFGDVIHTFVQSRLRTDLVSLPGFGKVTRHRNTRFGEIDHFAVCVEPGQLAETVEYYRATLDFQVIFAEHIRVGTQAMDSQVVQSRSGAVTLTILEPDVSYEPGQIDSFLKSHGGSGVQHVALTADNILRVVDSLRQAGVAFLRTPGTYYDMLAERMDVVHYGIEDLRQRDILVDEDHDGQLFQIFAKSTHPRNTFFMEVIERMGARTFGSGNIKALYEAVERYQTEEQIGE